MTTYIQKIRTTNDLFKNKGLTIYGGDSFETLKEISFTPMPDTTVLCGWCNDNLYPNDGFMVCHGVQNFESDNWSDVYHEECTLNFNDIIKVEGYLFE